MGRFKVASHQGILNRGQTNAVQRRSLHRAQGQKAAPNQRAGSCPGLCYCTLALSVPDRALPVDAVLAAALNVLPSTPVRVLTGGPLSVT